MCQWTISISTSLCLEGIWKVSSYQRSWMSFYMRKINRLMNVHLKFVPKYLLCASLRIVTSTSLYWETSLNVIIYFGRKTSHFRLGFKYIKFARLKKEKRRLFSLLWFKVSHLKIFVIIVSENGENLAWDTNIDLINYDINRNWTTFSYALQTSEAQTRDAI